MGTFGSQQQKRFLERCRQLLVDLVDMDVVLQYIGHHLDVLLHFSRLLVRLEVRGEFAHDVASAVASVAGGFRVSEGAYGR